MIAITVGVLAVLQGGTIGYLVRRSRTKPLTYMVKGHVTSVTISRNLDGPSIGSIEYSDQSEGWFTKVTKREKKQP